MGSDRAARASSWTWHWGSCSSNIWASFSQCCWGGGRCDFSRYQVSDLHCSGQDHYWNAKASVHPTTISVRRRFPRPAPDRESAPNATIKSHFGTRFNRVGWSFLIEIGASSHSPEKSAQIANAVATAYIDDQQQAKREANQTASAWLQERLQELERAVVTFKQQNNIVSADGKRLDEQNLADLNKRLVAAGAQSADILAGLTRIECILRTWNPNASTIDDSISDELGSKFSQTCDSNTSSCPERKRSMPLSTVVITAS